MSETTPDKRDEAPAEPAKDVVLVHGVTEDGRGANVLRFRPDRVEAGQVRPIEPEKPLTGELVTLKRRPEAPVLFDVTTEVESPYAEAEARARSERSGPARVSTPRYRQGWDTIWGVQDDGERLLN